MLICDGIMDILLHLAHSVFALDCENRYADGISNGFCGDAGGIEQQNLCGSDYIKLQQLQEQQSELEARLDEKMERWVYLTELKEKIDAQ